MYNVYILKSLKDGKHYIGITDNIDRRIEEHNSGKNTSTSYRRPLILEYFEELNSREEARNREKYFKTGAGRRWINKNIK